MWYAVVMRFSSGIYTIHPFRWGSRPKLIAGTDLGPILEDRSCSGRKYHATHPKTRNLDTSGFCVRLRLRAVGRGATTCNGIALLSVNT